MNASGPWPFRVAWATLPLTLGPTLNSALDGRSEPVAWVVATGCWALWAGGLLVSLLPRPVGLTAIRLAGPSTVLVALAAVAAGASAPLAALGVAAALAAAATALAPTTADAFVDGASYGDERRLTLRVPPALLVGPLPLAWLVTAAGAATGPLLLASRQWVGGALALAIGWPLVAAAVVRVHQLSRRWAVFVPAGLVLHDRLVLSEPVLLPRSDIARLGPAEVGSSATDLTAGSLGLVIEVRLTDPVSAGVRTGAGESESRHLDAILFGPARPGALLEEARRRRITVG